MMKGNSYFINPYNFIKLPEKKREAYKDEDKHTGVIEYSITTRSPLFIPNTSNDNAFLTYEKEQAEKDRHKSYDFYSYTELEPGKDYREEYHTPIIPGSELRGMLRSIYETLTDSCMGVFNEEVYPVRRTAEAYKPALLHKTNRGYELVEAEDCLMRTKGENSLEDSWQEDKALRKGMDWEEEKEALLDFYMEQFLRDCYIQDELKEGDKVLFRLKKRGTKCKPLAVQVEKYRNGCKEKEIGYILKTEKGPEIPQKTIDGVESLQRELKRKGSLEDKKLNKLKNNERVIRQRKHCCHILKPIVGNKQICKLSEEDISRLKAVVDSYQEQVGGEHAYKEYKGSLKSFLGDKGEEFFPVYYSKVKVEKGKDIIFLSPSCFTREVAEKRLGEYTKIKTCKKKENRCPACNLFGMVGIDNENAVASKIRIADAYLDGFHAPVDTIISAEEAKKIYGDIVTLQTLGGPKIANTDFYLQKPEDADFWTYDYYTKQGKIFRYEAVLGGRKYYWHQKDKELPRDIERTKFNKTIRPIQTGVTFYGKLYYEKISHKQLQQLLWILNGGNDGEQPKSGPIAYKLGNGKPLGLGSVELKVSKVTERKVCIKDDMLRYEEMEERPEIFCYEKNDFNGEVKENFFKISSLNAFDEEEISFISYPVTEEQRLGQGKNQRFVGSQQQGEKQDAENKDEGFKWFVSNHTGYDYRRNQEIKMPTQRVQMKIQNELAEIQNPKMDCNPKHNGAINHTKATESRKKDNPNGMNGSKGNSNKGNTKAETRPKKEREQGVVYDVKVTGHPKDTTGKYQMVEVAFLEDGEKLLIPFQKFIKPKKGIDARAIQIGNSYRIRYNRSSLWNPDWEVVKV